jgi:hypothetical protein
MPEICVSDRRRFGHVNVVCVLCNIVLVGRLGMGEGAEQGGSEMRQLTMSKGPAGIGIRNCVSRATIPSKRFSHLNNPLYI